MVQSGIASSARVMDSRGPDPAIGHGGRYTIVDLGLVDLTQSAADINLYVPNGLSPTARGRVIHLWCKDVITTTDTNADATLTLEINGSSGGITGGVITLADIADGTTSRRVSVDNIHQGTVITAGTEFDGNDYIDVAYAVTNAFGDGVTRVYALIEWGINS